VFYGRSAGGLLAANIAHQYHNLVGAVYAEVPYVDVLRTTTNPDLPLTQLEYDEFGDPRRRPEEYAALQQISPVDTVPFAPKGAPLVLVRTGVHDAQVLPYEALKWAKKLRCAGWNVLVGIDGNGGHFAAADVMYGQQAEDAALITAQLTSQKRRTTRKSGRLHSYVGTRRNRISS
jgi:oligopeptidase B